MSTVEEDGRYISHGPEYRAIVAAIPEGHWMSYGDVAVQGGRHRLAGRAVGTALMDPEADSFDFPSFRVFMDDGSVPALLRDSANYTAKQWEAHYHERYAAEGLLGPNGKADPAKRLQVGA